MTAPAAAAQRTSIGWSDGLYAGARPRPDLTRERPGFPRAADNTDVYT
jgi:hypothetical protein